MRALVFTAPASDTSTSRVDHLDIPVPGRGQVSIDVDHAGVNFKDVMSRRGDSGYVTGRLKAGDRVAAYTGEGGLAEVAIAEANLTVAVPAGLDLQRAAAAPGALVSAALLVGNVGQPRAGQTLLVHGATGGVGQAVAQLAHLAGAGLVLGTVGSMSRAKVAASMLWVESGGWRDDQVDDALDCQHARCQRDVGQRSEPAHRQQGVGIGLQRVHRLRPPARGHSGACAQEGSDEGAGEEGCQQEDSGKGLSLRGPCCRRGDGPARACDLGWPAEER